MKRRDLLYLRFNNSSFLNKKKGHVNQNLGILLYNLYGQNSVEKPFAIYFPPLTCATLYKPKEELQLPYYITHEESSNNINCENQ